MKMQIRKNNLKKWGKNSRAAYKNTFDGNKTVFAKPRERIDPASREKNIIGTCNR